MSNQSDAEYYARRAREHHKLSKATWHLHISAIHAELAARYEERVRELSASNVAPFPVSDEPTYDLPTAENLSPSRLQS